MLRLALFSAAAITLAACGNSGETPEPTDQAETATDMTCTVNNPRDVNIWINAMPGMNDNPTLIAEFTVTAPTPGYSFDLTHIETMESMPPIFIYKLEATPPDGMTIQVETDVEIRIEKSGLEYEELAGVQIYCGGDPFISLDEVLTAY